MAHRVLVVDDERNICLAISQALSPLELEVEQALDGEEALRKIERGSYDLVLLDLRLPGIDGVEVLRRMRDKGSRVRVVVVTAYGTVDSAVAGFKLGAVDFVQKPFSPDEIRGVVTRALASPPERMSGEGPGYDECVNRGRDEIHHDRFEAARPWVCRALALDPSRPEAANLLGVLEDLTGRPMQAQKYYRVALELDPRYQAARENLERSTTLGEGRGRIQVG
jgi:DNA-binding response OmpR family regulator